jgi:hypothetical protein
MGRMGRRYELRICTEERRQIFDYEDENEDEDEFSTINGHSAAGRNQKEEDEDEEAEKEKGSIMATASDRTSNPSQGRAK